MKKLSLIVCAVLMLVGVVYAAQDEPVISNGQAVWPQYYNGTMFRNPRIDSSTRGTITVDYYHHEVHAGDAYFVSGTTMLGSGATCAMAMAVPNTTKSPHLSMVLSSTGIVNAYLIESAKPRFVNTTLVSGGTAYNHDRNSSNRSGCTVGWIPNWSPPIDGQYGGGSMSGNTLYYMAFGTNGQAQTSVGGQAARENELILKSGTTYMMLFYSGTAGNLISYHLNWYEHTPESD